MVSPQVLAYRTPLHFTEWLAERRGALHVATRGHRVLGFVSVDGAEVVRLYVGRVARGAGVAQELLSHGEALLAARGVEEAELFCTAGNARAERFYAREKWLISHTFEETLWVPAGTAETFVAPTHGYRKRLA